MACILRPLMQWPRWRHRHLAFFHLLSLHTSTPYAFSSPLFLKLFSTSTRAVRFSSRAVRLSNVRSPSAADVSDDESSSDGDFVKKSRNEKKREARRAVRWAMELVKFSPSQIKPILRVAALEQEVFDAIMVVKGLSRDVREGKRRQLSYIGRLIREVEPELMEELIQATKDGDMSKFRDLSVTEEPDIVEEEKVAGVIEEDDEEDSINIALVTKWYDGLINKDMSITNEIYSLQEVEFDRQELRKLVRKVHSALKSEATSSEENEKPDVVVVNAKRSLTHFLHSLVKQLPSE